MQRYGRKKISSHSGFHASVDAEARDPMTSRARIKAKKQTIAYKCDCFCDCTNTVLEEYETGDHCISWCDTFEKPWWI